MTNWIYCGTFPPVDAAGTQELLQSASAVWCPPPGLRAWPGQPAPGDLLWLVWRAVQGRELLLLGAGAIVAAPRTLFGTDILWTGRDQPQLRDRAVAVGYGGGPAMSFVRVANPWCPAFIDLDNLEGAEEVVSRWNFATDEQSRFLTAVRSR